MLQLTMILAVTTNPVSCSHDELAHLTANRQDISTNNLHEKYLHRHTIHIINFVEFNCKAGTAVTKINEVQNVFSYKICCVCHRAVLKD